MSGAAHRTVSRSTTPEDERSRWRTPPTTFARAVALYGPFDLDAAADATSWLLPAWLGPGSPHAEDALIATWAGFGTRAFCNPPYSHPTLARFVACAAVQVRARGLDRATLLLPATTDVVWWHTHVWDGDLRRFRHGIDIQFLPGRVRFLRPDGTPATDPPGGSILLTFFR